MPTAIKRVRGVTKTSELEEGHNPRAKKRTTVQKEKVDISKIFDGMGDTIWLHNKSGAEFHVPFTGTVNSDNVGDVVVFETNEIKAFDLSEVNNKNIKKCLLDGKLEVIAEDKVDELVASIEATRRKQSSGNKSAKAGVSESGLPNSKRAALNYIFECEDEDELEGYLQLEDRDFIVDAIEERLEELEDSQSNIE